MKKILTLIFAFTLFASNSYAQRSIDLEVSQIIEPSELRTGQGATPWPMQVVLKNNGTDTVKIGDTLVWLTYIVDTLTNFVVDDYPNNAAQGSAVVYELTKGINPGDTIHFRFDTITPFAATPFSRDVRVVFCAGILNTSDLISPDPVQTNNCLTMNIVWYNLEGWGVSVEDIDYTENINAYPNPANEVLKIRLHAVNFEGVRIEMYDNMGNLVLSESHSTGFDNNHYELNTSEVAEGMYMLKVTYGEQVSTSKVFILH